MTEHMREVLEQISVVKSCVAELRETRWLDGQSRQMVRVRIGAAISQAMPGATMLALPVIGQIVLLCYGGWSVMNGRIDLGTFVAFASFLAMLTGPTRVLASFLVIAQRTQRRWSASSRLSTRVLAWKTVLSRLKVRLSGWTWRR